MPETVHHTLLFSMVPLYILLGLLLLPCSSAANDTLTAGQVLAVGDKLVSRNGKFALGFFQAAASAIPSKFPNTTSPGANWYLGIWFNQIPVFTTVWVANRDDPIADDPKLNLTTHLKISSEGNLFIVHDDAVIWSAHTANNSTSINTTTTSVVLMNTANLVLTSSSDQVLWESFDYPTDVVLPGAKFGWNKVNRLNRVAISKKSTVDPGSGSYSVELETNGNGIILKRREPSLVYRTYAPESSSILKLMPRIKKILSLDPRTKGVIIPD